MSKKFGTDGIRGIANAQLTVEDCLNIGMAAGTALREAGKPLRVVMGRDTRRSGPALGAAVAAGFCAVGVDPVSLGVVPTGAVSAIARAGEFSLGVVISASHNPAPDNGIKLIADDGRKVSSEFESRVETLMAEGTFARPEGAAMGALQQDRGPIEPYMQMLEEIVPERLDGMRIAIDAAHGAGYELGVEIFQLLGAEVVTTGVTPDGLNINAEGGATKPATIQQFTKESGAHIGIAYDGDADRAVFSDEQGRLINGDRTMAMWCAHWRESLQPPSVVGTVMSNSGFANYMHSVGITLERAAVGDKYVSARMSELGAKIGGEQSGHIIFSERGPTGDGLITALEVVRVLKRSGRAASEFYGDYLYWPQLLLNLRVSSKEAVLGSAEIAAAVEEAQAKLGATGRINLRPSGTQPVVRLMVEAESYETRDAAADAVFAALEKYAGAHVEGRVDLTHALGD